MRIHQIAHNMYTKMSVSIRKSIESKNIDSLVMLGA